MTPTATATTTTTTIAPCVHHPESTTYRLSGSEEPLWRASDPTEVVLLIGPPACGKSTLTSVHFPSHLRVNQVLRGQLGACCRACTVHARAHADRHKPTDTPPAHVRAHTQTRTRTLLTISVCALLLGLVSRMC